MTLGLSREHRVSAALTIITLMLSAGAMLAYTTYFIVNQVTTASEAQTRALADQRALFTQQLETQRDFFTQQLEAQQKRYNDEHTMMLQRVVTLETSAIGRDKAIDRLDTLMDQVSAVLRDMSVSQKSLEATLEAMSKQKR